VYIQHANDAVAQGQDGADLPLYVMCLVGSCSVRWRHRP